MDNLIEFRVWKESADHRVFPFKKKLCAKRCMIHRIRGKAVIQAQLLESSNVMKQRDQLCQLLVFFI